MSKNWIQIRQSLILLTTACIWGFAFVAQSVGNDLVGPLTFNCIRFFLGGIALLPIVLLNKNKKNVKKSILSGIIVGFIVYLASTFQQYGILYTNSVGKAGFITAFYILFVPIVSFLFLHKKNNKWIYVCILVALVGLYFLCMDENQFIPDFGDCLLLLCALCFTADILVVDHFTNDVDGVTMSCTQFFVASAIGFIPMCVEGCTFTQILNGWQPILYAGFLSCGIAYTLQIIGQKDLNPTLASMIMSLESCISVLAGALLLNQNLTSRELFGCALMFIAIIASQLIQNDH